MSSYQYIIQNFLTLPQLSESSGVSQNRIVELMEAGCFPHASYTLEIQGEIHSFFGSFEESASLEFFPRSMVDLITELAKSPVSVRQLATELKQAFFKVYERSLKDLDAESYGLAGFFEPDGKAGGEALSNFLEQEWAHYLDGTYGVCTHTSCAEDIALKEVMIAKIKFLCSEIDAGGGDANLAALEDAVSKLDAVSASFAPHEVARSSREKYINAVRKNYLSGGGRGTGQLQ